MTAIEMIKELFTLKAELIDSAAKAADFTDDEKLLCSVARWAAASCGEDEGEVLQAAKALVEEDAMDLSLLRDFLEFGRKPWRFEGNIFGSDEQYAEWRRTRCLITIHRGTKQIGGSIIEITMGNANVLVDLGSSLPGSQGIGDEEIIKKIFDRHHRSIDHHIDAVFFTHYHGDHVGLLDKIPADVPLYMDSAMFEIMRTLHKNTGNKVMQELLENRDGRIHTFTPAIGEVITLGEKKDMTIIPFFVDHSAYHANMFLFEGAGHTILHSGDFRGTGYMGKSIDLIPKIIHEKYGKEVDVLLTEGTMMTRSTEKEHLFTEWEVHKEAKAFMKDHRQIFVVCSSTNFDSLTSICNAATANNIPIYGSPYIIAMMKTFKGMAEKYRPQLPAVQRLDELWPNSQKGFVYLLGSLSGISKDGAHKLVHNLGKHMRGYRPYLLYSMWQGYLDEKHPAFNEGLKAFVGEFDGRVKYIHSTGHADKGTLAKFIQDIAPRKFIVPFHTEDAGGFKSLEIEEKYKDMVILPDDGDTIELA